MYGQYETPQLGKPTIFRANSPAVGVGFQTYNIPAGTRLLIITAIGAGGGGGNGVIGANSVSAGGGGGGSASMATVQIAPNWIPKTLYVLVGVGGAPVSVGNSSRVMIYPEEVRAYTIALGNGGAAGGNATAGTAGAGGLAGAASSINNCNIASIGIANFIAGQAGGAGGAAVTAAQLSFPATTGLFTTGGTGGGGLPAAAALGTSGGALNSALVWLPNLPGGIGGAAIIPAGNGSNGPDNNNGWAFSYGGAGGASTHGTATGAGLAQSSGGRGSIGSGGGATGGALTGSTAGVAGRGGDGLVSILAI